MKASVSKMKPALNKKRKEKQSESEILGASSTYHPQATWQANL
jgi:hypothetical protein